MENLISELYKAKFQASAQSGKKFIIANFLSFFFLFLVEGSGKSTTFSQVGNEFF
jgi:hypothetical protein